MSPELAAKRFVFKRVRRGHYRTNRVNGLQFVATWTKNDRERGYWSVVENVLGSMPSWVTTTWTLNEARIYVNDLPGVKSNA